MAKISTGMYRSKRSSTHFVPESTHFEPKHSVPVCVLPSLFATCPMPRKRPRQAGRSSSRAGSSLSSQSSERSSPDVKKEAQTQSRLRVRTTPTISNATTPSRGSKAQILCTNAKGRHVMSVTFRTKNAQLGAKVRYLRRVGWFAARHHIC